MIAAAATRRIVWARKASRAALVAWLNTDAGKDAAIAIGYASQAKPMRLVGLARKYPVGKDGEVDCA